MKVLSIQQPWPYFILHCGKDIENRNWKPTNPGLRFRGPVLIHAGKKMDPDFSMLMSWASRRWKIPATILAGALPLGGIVGRMEIIDCVQESTSQWFNGPYGFVLDKAEPVEFMAWKGQLGFFEGPMEFSK